MHSEGVGCGSTFYMKLPVYTRNQYYLGNIDLLSSSFSSSSSLPLSSLSNNIPPIVGIKYLSIDINSNENTSIDEEEKIQTPEEIREELKRKKLFFGLKVLIVDDAPMIRKLMTKLLSSKGSICDTAEDGVHSVEIMKKVDFEKS